MSESYTLMTPGPVPVPPEVLRVLAQPMEHHRTPEFNAVLARVLERLKPVFGTSERVYLQTSTGSGGMEAALVNVLSPGDEVLAIVSGKFGERWAEMAEAYGAVVRRLDVEWGRSVRVEDVARELKARPKTKLVLSQACETSTGALHPIRDLAQLTRDSETLLLIDGITALGALPMPMDEWGIDVIVGGSQKAFMLPTGLSFLSFSKKAWKVVESARCPRFYFDMRAERKANEAGETHYSSNVPLIKALDVVLERFSRDGIESVYRRIQKLSDATLSAAQEMGLASIARNPSPSLSALALPDGIDGQKVRAEMEKAYRVVVMGGQDKFKGKILRIGHMGYIRDEDLLQTIEALGRVLMKMKPETFTEEKLSRALASARRRLESK